MSGPQPSPFQRVPHRIGDGPNWPRVRCGAHRTPNEEIGKEGRRKKRSGVCHGRRILMNQFPLLLRTEEGRGEGRWQSFARHQSEIEKGGRKEGNGTEAVFHFGLLPFFLRCRNVRSVLTMFYKGGSNVSLGTIAVVI